MKARAALAIACTVLTACQAVSPLPRAHPTPSAAASPGEEVVFYVHGATAGGPQMLQEVSVWMVTREGRLREIGKTDVFGGISIRKHELADGVVLGFSLEGFFDGAWRVDAEELTKFDELHVGLAPFSVF